VQATIPGTLAFLGLSGAAGLLGYAKAWQWLMRRLTTWYLLDFE